jgi:hypothetical protein
MDATTRWETEAIRSSSHKRATPPRPTAKRRTATHGQGTWVTLKDAEVETGIPANTLRKWVRKEAIESYLESDGELSLRMVNLDSVIARAEALGRMLNKPVADESASITDSGLRITEADGRAEAEERETVGGRRMTSAAESVVPEGSLLVPLDAWNKMVNQLGNLHEAGQQLAEARERAAKAETEALFLRERLSDLREEQAATDLAAEAADTRPTEPRTTETALKASVADHIEVVPAPADASETVQTTTYLRYLTTGWRDRKRRGNR